MKDKKSYPIQPLIKESTKGNEWDRKLQYSTILWLDHKDSLNPRIIIALLTTILFCLVFHKKQSNVQLTIQLHWLVQFQKHSECTALNQQITLAMV